MGDFDSYSPGDQGLAAFGAGIQGFAKGMMDAEDRKFKRIEMDAKLKAQDSEIERNALKDALEQKKAEADQYKNRIQKNAETGAFETRPLNEVELGDEKRKYENDLAIAKARAEANAALDPYGTKALGAVKAKQDVAKGQLEAQQMAKGKALAPDKVLSVQQGAQIPKQLDDLSTTIESNLSSFGPLVGRAGAMNPYNTKAQTIDSQMRASAQAFGRYMEGGVLRKEDEEKYRKMFPNLSDTPDVAKNKLAIVKKLLVDKQNADTEALKTQGYDTAGFSPLESAQLPGVLTGKKQGLVPQGLVTQPQGLVQTQAPQALTPQDSEAVKWAKANPKDPRSAQILKANGF